MQKEDTKLGGFDPLVVHHRDEETKMVSKVNAFRVIVHKGVRFYEWPKGSSNLWFENRVAAGRLSEEGDPIRNKAHEEWKPPITADAQVGQQNKVLEQENKKLMAELSAIKKEQEIDQKLKPKEAKTPKVNTKTVEL